MSNPAPNNPDAAETEPFPHDDQVAVASTEQSPRQIEATLDVAIEEMLAQLEPVERTDEQQPPESDVSPAAAEPRNRHGEITDRAEPTDISSALTPINATLQQQSEALMGLTQALQGLQLAVADLQFASRQPHSSGATVAGPTASQTAIPDCEQESAAAPTADSEPAPEQCWDQIKAALLNTDQTPAADTPQPDETAADPTEDDLHYELVSHADILQMEDEQLRKLLLDQERVISRLVQSARAERKASMAFSPEDLRAHDDDMPDELAEQVRATLQTLDEQARLGELELSLERARISRQLSHLEDTRQILESNARALGLEIGPEGRIVGDPKSVRNAGTKGRRWLGALGFGD